MNTKNISLQYSLTNRDLNKKLFKYLLWIALVGVLIYMYFIGSIVFNIIARKGIETENRLLTSELASMQVTYLSTLGSIDLEYAKNAGFKEATNIAYVKSNSTVGLLNANEI